MPVLMTDLCTATIFCRDFCRDEACLVSTKVSTKDGCCAKIGHQNRHCYRAQCFETSRLLAKALEIKDEDYTVCFQSRLGKSPWIKPYTDEIIRQLPAKGKKKVLAFAPSFVADCLETIIEVGEEYRILFENSGGEKWQMVESLNTHPLWVKMLKEVVVNDIWTHLVFCIFLFVSLV